MMVIPNICERITGGRAETEKRRSPVYQTGERQEKNGAQALSITQEECIKNGNPFQSKL
jgi:hypothetical protein